METVGVPAEDVLLHRPWLPVSIDGCQLLAKTWFGETSYRVLLTDMHCVWEETMDAASIQSRAQELNRRLRASVKAFFSHLCEVAQPCLSGGPGRAGGEAQTSLTRRDDGHVSVRLKSELAGLPFYWEFRCSPAPVALVCVQLVRPLLVMSHLLQLQAGQLGGLLVRKDAEIQDYRENGATLSRERLQTDVFDDLTYRENFMTKTLPGLWSERSDALGFDADLQQLYAAVVAHRTPRKRKVSEERLSEEEEAEEAAVTASESVSEERHKEQEEPSHNQTTNRPTTQQSKPAERPSSKPKKKKVGLFR